ncbi:MAG TPA: GNAT family N-acetyltransferase [Gammaproteobacteria bacterium]
MVFGRLAERRRSVDIRPLELRDAPAVFRAVDESRAEISRWMDWCKPTYGPADAEEWIRSSLRGREDGSCFQFGIFDGRRFLGACGLSHVDDAAGVANLGYWVRTRATGQGVAPEAARRVIAWGFAHTDLERIEILAATGNRRSQRVAEKIGAVREGVLRSRLSVFGRRHDAVLYSVVRADLLPDRR